MQNLASKGMFFYTFYPKLYLFTLKSLSIHTEVYIFFKNHPFLKLRLCMDTKELSLPSLTTCFCSFNLYKKHIRSYK